MTRHTLRATALVASIALCLCLTAPVIAAPADRGPDRSAMSVGAWLVDLMSPVLALFDGRSDGDQAVRPRGPRSLSAAETTTSGGAGEGDAAPDMDPDG